MFGSRHNEKISAVLPFAMDRNGNAYAAVGNSAPPAILARRQTGTLLTLESP